MAKIQPPRSAPRVTEKVVMRLCSDLDCWSTRISLRIHKKWSKDKVTRASAQFLRRKCGAMEAGERRERTDKEGHARVQDEAGDEEAGHGDAGHEGLEDEAAPAPPSPVHDLMIPATQRSAVSSGQQQRFGRQRRRHLKERQSGAALQSCRETKHKQQPATVLGFCVSV